VTVIDGPPRSLPCDGCGVLVVGAELLVVDGRRGNVTRQPVTVEPWPVPVVLTIEGAVEPELLLHLGTAVDSGKWLFVSLFEPASVRTARWTVLPHGHRVHVCAAVPATWSASQSTGAPS
jgi:hypothetical protein